MQSKVFAYRHVSLLVLTLVLSLLGFSELNARHIVGGEVTYECIGQPDANTRRYKIVVNIYRDALGNGADFDSSPGGSGTFEMSIFQGSVLFRTIEIRSGDLDIVEVDVQDPDPCVRFPLNIRTQRGRYETEVSLPISSQTYTVSYQRCCRNNAITNIVNPGDAGATYSIEIPPQAQEECNSSPTFVNFAPISICANKTLVFDHSATDVDGDRLVYGICEPYYGGGNETSRALINSFVGVMPNPESPPPYDPVVFRAPFTADVPIDGSPGLAIDPDSGVLTVKPDNVGLYLVCISVQEYRNGVLIGEVRRDFQFSVVDCSPSIIADVASPAALDSLSFGFIQFCGTRDIQLFNASQSNQVGGGPLEVEWLLEGTVNGDVSSTSDVVEATYPNYGLYDCQIIAAPGLECADTLDFTVRLTPPTFPVFDFVYDTCEYGPVEFTNTSFTEADSIVFYEWDFGSNEFSTDFEPAHQYQTAGNRIITLTVRDNFGCVYDTSTPISFFPVPNLLNPGILDEGCAPSLAEFRQNLPLITEEYDVFWDFGNGVTSTELDPNYVYTEPGVYNIYLSAVSPIGCFIDTQIQAPIRILESPVSDFILDPQEVDITSPEINFFDRSIDAVSWQWYFDSIGTSREENPRFEFPDTGQYKIDLIVSHLNGCLDTSTQFLRVAPFQSFYMPNAFTPNGDGTNERFLGAGFTSLFSDFEMKIFNRWGELVFTTNDPDEGWDGISQRNGKEAQPGVYLYIVDYTDPEGDKQLTGYATLVR